MKSFKFKIILSILIAFALTGLSECISIAPAYSRETKDDIDKAESDNLGLIIKNIEMVEEKPVAAAVYNLKTGKTLEYIAGDYIDGKLIKDILDDRIVLLDELTKHQYVLIFNDTVTEAEPDESDESVPVIRTRDKKKFTEGMDVTIQFNKALKKITNPEDVKESDDFLKKLNTDNVKNFSDSALEKDGDTASASLLNNTSAGEADTGGTAEVKVNDDISAASGNIQNKNNAKTPNANEAENKLNSVPDIPENSKNSAAPRAKTSEIIVNKSQTGEVSVKSKK